MMVPRMVGLAMAVALCAGAQQVNFKENVVDPDPPERPYTKIVADFNGDGQADIAIGGWKGPLLWYAYPDWTPRMVVTGGYETVDGEAADLDGDGDLDIVMGGTYWYENPGPEAIARAASWAIHLVGKRKMHDVEVGDLDGDGKLDILTRNQSAFGGPTGNVLYLWKQEGPDSWPGRTLDCPNGEGIRLFDLDRDGDLDIVIPGLWYENPGSILEGTWAEHDYTDTWDYVDAEVQVGDINGDGRADIVLSPSELKGNTYRVSWFEGPERLGDAPWKEHVIEPETETVLHSLGLADIDGDGAVDVATAKMHQGVDPDEVRLYLNGDQGQRWTKIVISTLGSHDIALADIGGDGDIDIVGANHAGDIQAVHLWENLTQNDAGHPPGETR